MSNFEKLQTFFDVRVWECDGHRRDETIEDQEEDQKTISDTRITKIRVPENL